MLWPFRGDNGASPRWAIGYSIAVNEIDSIDDPIHDKFDVMLPP